MKQGVNLWAEYPEEKTKDLQITKNRISYTPNFNNVVVEKLKKEKAK